MAKLWVGYSWERGGWVIYTPLGMLWWVFPSKAEAVRHLRLHRSASEKVRE